MITWDKTFNGRNLQKTLKLPQPSKCPLCEISDATKAHLVLRCSHPLIQVARDSFRTAVFQRIGREARVPGRVYLISKWTRVFEPNGGSCTLAEEMGGTIFITGHPLRRPLWTDTDEHRLTRDERSRQTRCVCDLLDSVTIFLRQLERLMRSLSAALEPIQQHLVM